MTVTPYTTISDLRSLVARTYRQQAFACLASVFNVLFAIFYAQGPWWLTPMVAVNLLGLYAGFGLFNSAGKARSSLRLLIALKQDGWP